MTQKYYVAGRPTITTRSLQLQSWIFSVCFIPSCWIYVSTRLQFLKINVFFSKSRIDKPVTRIASPKVLNVNIGGKVKVICEVVKANPVVILEYLWSVPGNPEIVGGESYLSIDRVSLRGNNTLQCSARNSVGWSDAASVAINVLCEFKI